MEFIINKEELLESLSLIQGIIPKNITIPILGNILFKAKNDKLRIYATNLEVYFKTVLKEKRMREGEITLCYKDLFNVVKGIEGKEIHFRIKDDNYIELSSNNQSYIVSTISADDYPVFINIKKDLIDLFEIKSSLLLEAINKTIFATSKDENRHHLQGVYFTWDKKKFNLKLVATDGYRVNLIRFKDIKVSKLINDKEGLILPTNDLLSLKKILSKYQEQNVKISLLKKYESVLFRIGKIRFIVKIIQGNFPDYKQIVPTNKENQKVMIINREGLISALQRLGKFYHVIDFELTKNNLSLGAHNEEKGQHALESLPIKYIGKKFKISFTNQYLLDFLKVIKTKKVIFKMIEFNDVVVIKEKIKEEESELRDFKYTYYLMPFFIKKAN